MIIYIVWKNLYVGKGKKRDKGFKTIVAGVFKFREDAEKMAQNIEKFAKMEEKSILAMVTDERIQERYEDGS